MLKLCLWCDGGNYPFPSSKVPGLDIVRHLFWGWQRRRKFFLWRFFASVAAVSPLSCVLCSGGHRGASACPQPGACPSFLDYRQSLLIPRGKCLSITILMITMFLCCRQSVLVSPVLTPLGLSACHPSPWHLPKSHYPLVEYLPYFMS